MEVGTSKKVFFCHQRSKLVDLSNFENLIFPKKLFDFESKFPFVGEKSLTEISVKKFG
jgi:hypothetical protein